LPWRSNPTFHHFVNNQIYLLFPMSPPPTPVVQPLAQPKNLRSRATSTPPHRGGVNPPDLSTTSAPPPPLPWDGDTTPDHRKRPTASTTAESVFKTVAGRNTTPLNRDTVATSATPPSQSTFAVLDAADESHTGALAAGTDFDTTKEGDNGVDHTEGTAQEDGDSQPLLDAITDPIIDALTAHARVLTSTLPG
jgi:hypothetical protein